MKMTKALPVFDCGTTARERFFLASLFAASGVTLKKPERIAPSAWTGHVPFAFWIVHAAQPGVIVELGSHYGVSFAAFCQQAVINENDCLCYAVDTWEGDEHAGFYGEDVFRDTAAHINNRYPGRAHLLRTTFDEAVKVFDDGSIDLLHIDGCHTREAMLHDFETWLPKLSRRGIVLMHDVNARIPGYRGFDAWREIADKYPHFSFDHAFGLGVVLTGPEAPDPVAELTLLGASAANQARRYFSHAGTLCEALFGYEAAIKELQKAKSDEITRIQEKYAEDLNAARENQAREFEEYKKADAEKFEWEKKNTRNAMQETDRLRLEMAALNQQISALNNEIENYKNSNSWKMTAPLRKLRRLFR